MTWFNKIANGEQSAPEIEVPSSWIAQVETLLKQLDGLPARESRPGLASDIMGYVLRGDQAGVLSEISRTHAVAEALQLTTYAFGLSAPAVDNLYREFEKVPAAVALRWARVLEASVTQPLYTPDLFLKKGQQWPEFLMRHAANWGLDVYMSNRPKLKHLTAATMAALLEQEGLDLSILLVGTLTARADSLGARNHAMMTTELAGIGEAFDHYSEIVRPHLLPAAVDQKLHVVDVLSSLPDAVLARFSDEIVELATSSSKQVRAATEPLVGRCSSATVDPLKIIAAEGKPDQRLAALRLLWSIARVDSNEALKAYVQAASREDKAPSVQALTREWEAIPADTALDPESSAFEMPVINWEVGLTAQFSTKLDSLWVELNAGIERSNLQLSKLRAHAKSRGHLQTNEYQLLTPEELQELKDYLASPLPKLVSTRVNFRQLNWYVMSSAIKSLEGNDPASPVAILKTLAYFDFLVEGNQALASGVARIMNEMYACHGRPSLLELSTMLEALGVPTQALFNSYRNRWGESIARDWEAEAVWPFFAHKLDLLIQHLGSGAGSDTWADRSSLFRAVDTFPSPPTQVINVIFDLALGSAKADRALAQSALAETQGKEARIIQALADGKAEVRAVAAQWLGRLKHSESIAALEVAVRKEKHDVPKGAMLDALQLMGQPVEKYLDRKAMHSDAEKAIGKGLPKELDWFSWEALPAVRWADSGEAVSTNTLKWMLAQAVKQKSPEPNAVLRKYCSMFEPRDREAFGQFVLEIWIAEDTRPISPDQAMNLARSEAQATHRFMRRSPEYFQNDPKLGMSEDQLVSVYLPGFLKQPAGSAIGSKGLLAVVAACAGQRAATVAGRYLKEFYGTRAAQGRALIAMLAWIEHPSATQLMLSIGSRFRTKSFQEEATRQAEALAERKGWTIVELADRTMPSAGFDETGTMELSYGQRRFLARLMPDFKIELFNQEDKKIAALPEPRQDDDADAVKDSKKALAGAKKEIKSIVDLQSSRLYEALCTERDWVYDDWNRYLNQHPIARLLVQRIVWCEVDDQGVAGLTFRPMDDGTLTDADDNAVALAGDARVRIAHDSNLRSELVMHWQQHLVDYKITPVFQQFGKGTYVLPEDSERRQEIADFEGYVIPAFSLRGRALKLGYTRGSTEDGGWFYTYEKRFPTLGFTAVIEFTGSPLPEENRTVALLKMSFRSTTNGTARESTLNLSDAPKVLLSECYNDLRMIAAAGSGHDPDWRKKTEY